MKKNYLLVGLTGLLLAGCSNEDVVSDGADSPKAISFGTFVQKPTKATPVTTATLQSGGNFLVMGYKTGNNTDGEWADADVTHTLNFMRQIVTMEKPASVVIYKYSPVKYWPVGNSEISFFAVSPADISTITPAAITTEAGVPTVSYTLAIDALKQKDLMLAAAINKTNEQVDFAFDHALTKIGFTANLGTDYSTDGRYVRITSIKLQGVAGKADYYVDATGAWTQTDPTVFDASYELKALENLVNSGYVTYNAGTASAINLENSYLMMVPADYSASATATLVVTYDISYPDGTISTNNTTSKALKDLASGAGNIWTKGSSVTYNLTITLGSGGGGSAVAFTATVTDWAAGSDVAIP